MTCHMLHLILKVFFLKMNFLVSSTFKVLKKYYILKQANQNIFRNVFFYKNSCSNSFRLILFFGVAQALGIQSRAASGDD